MKHLLLSSLLGTLLCTANAGTVQVVVSDKDGKPVPDVVVLIETAQKTAPKPAGTPVVIAQESLRFSPSLTVVPVGSTLRFVNRDAYDHHVRSTPIGPLGNTPPVTTFELRLDGAEAAPSPNDEYKSAAPARKRSGSTSADVKVDTPGAIGLGCHIHGSMRGSVYVSGTPWFAKTDSNGMASIDGVPEGSADLVLWHSDQLLDQPTQRLQVGPALLKSPVQLNFSPKRRRS